MAVTWSAGAIRLLSGVAEDRPVSPISLRPDGPVDGIAVPLVEVRALGHGRFPGSHRYADTTIGARLRYRDHQASADVEGDGECRTPRGARHSRGCLR